MVLRSVRVVDQLADAYGRQSDERRYGYPLVASLSPRRERQCVDDQVDISGEIPGEDERDGISDELAVRRTEELPEVQRLELNRRAQLLRILRGRLANSVAAFMAGDVRFRDVGEVPLDESSDLLTCCHGGSPSWRKRALATP